MGNLLETLEGRTLFAAVVPAAVAAAYATLVRDDATLKADVRAEMTTLHDQEKTIAADLKALGHSTSNAALFAKVQTAGGVTVNSIAAKTNAYVAAAEPAFRRFESAAAAYSAKPTTATGRQLTAAEAAVQKVEGKQLLALASEVSTGGGPLAESLEALGAANTGPSAQTLDADLQASGTDQETLAAAQYGHLVTTESDIAALLASD